MNETLQQLMNHRTYRHFDPQYQLSDAELALILKAARQAPTWMNGQFYSIVVLRDPALRKQLVNWNPGNPHMAESSIFLLFVADLARTKQVSELKEVPYDWGMSIEPLLVATTDAALALENTVVAVESLGLGSVVVGSIRKHAEDIIQLLGLPAYTFPLFGLSIGKPTVEMNIKPRLPEAAVVHYDGWQAYPNELLQEYDETMRIFGEARETKDWTQKFADYFQQLSPETRELLKKQQLLK